MSRGERQLLVLREEVVDVLVQHQPADRLQRQDVLGPGCGDIERVKVEPVLVIGVHRLNEQLPLGVVPGGDRIIKILGCMAVVRPADSDGVFLQQALDPTSWSPVELHVERFPDLVDQSVGVDARSFHVPVVLRNPMIVEEEGEGEQALRVVGEVVQDPPVLLDVGLWVRLESMDCVRELDRITDEEDREVVPHKIIVALRHTKNDRNAQDMKQSIRKSTPH